MANKLLSPMAAARFLILIAIIAAVSRNKFASSIFPAVFARRKRCALTPAYARAAVNPAARGNLELKHTERHPLGAGAFTKSIRVNLCAAIESKFMTLF
jgi:hypothetical protein